MQGAQCEKDARWDLWGAGFARGLPTRPLFVPNDGDGTMGTVLIVPNRKPEKKEEKAEE